jgi:hypothetical protein
MPVFRVLKRVDAYVVYEADIQAEDAKEAAEFAYDDDPEIAWREMDTVQFDASHVVTLDDEGNEIDETKWGKG